VADIDGRNERRLTDVHREWLVEVSPATRPSETVRWRSTDGTEIEGFLMFPHGYDAARGPYPLIVMNHEVRQPIQGGHPRRGGIELDGQLRAVGHLAHERHGVLRCALGLVHRMLNELRWWEQYLK